MIRLNFLSSSVDLLLPDDQELLDVCHVFVFFTLTESVWLDCTDRPETITLEGKHSPSSEARGTNANDGVSD